MSLTVFNTSGIKKLENKRKMDSNNELMRRELVKKVALCRQFLLALNEAPFLYDNVAWYKDFCEELTVIVGDLGDHEEALQDMQVDFFLYFNQIVTNLTFLTRIFNKEDHLQLVLNEARKVVVKQIDVCLDSLQNLLKSGKKNERTRGFVNWVDLTLAKISEINALDIDETHVKFEKLKACVEEVLSNAMSIAQITLEQDSRAIRGSCQAVLINMSILELELTKENLSMVAVYTRSINDKVCSLEQKVNLAVLRLCLKSFMALNEPLQKIHEHCFKTRDNEATLNGLIADFDLHVDRLMQIGLFAESCCCPKRGAKIRSCLASMEGLESELVPAYLNALQERSASSKTCALLLRKHWLHVAEKLQRHVYLIIDPFAFCQIVYEEMSQVITNYGQHLFYKQELMSRQDVADLIKIGNVLKNFLAEAHEEFDKLELAKINDLLKDFKNVLEEVASASKLLTSTSNLQVSMRVHKRCKVLLTVLKRLWVCFAEQEPEDNSPDKNRAVLFPCTPPPLSTVNISLEHLTKKGRQILQERSVMYRTPAKVQAFKPTVFTYEAPKRFNITTRNISFGRKGETNETELTFKGIVEEMANLTLGL